MGCLSSQHDMARNEIDTRLAPQLASLFANLERILHHVRLQHDMHIHTERERERKRERDDTFN